MFHKTSSVEFLKYGDVSSEANLFQVTDPAYYTLPVQNRDIIYLYQADEDVCLHTSEGICLLVISETLDKEDFRTFVIHRYVRIRKGIFFNFIDVVCKMGTNRLRNSIESNERNSFPAIYKSSISWKIWKASDSKKRKFWIYQMV